MKIMAKDVILLCKGWYDKEKYPTLFEALRERYLKTIPDFISDDDFIEEMKSGFTVKSLLYNILEPTMKEIVLHYNDRMRDFLIYLFYCCNEKDSEFGYSDENNCVYILSDVIIKFLSSIRFRGDKIIEINVDEYFYNGYDETGARENKLVEDII